MGFIRLVACQGYQLGKGEGKKKKKKSLSPGPEADCEQHCAWSGPALPGGRSWGPLLKEEKVF